MRRERGRTGMASISDEAISFSGEHCFAEFIPLTLRQAQGSEQVVSADEGLHDSIRWLLKHPLARYSGCPEAPHLPLPLHQPSSIEI